MPITFIDIERRKSWKIGLFFLLLVFLYFVITPALFLSLVPIYQGFLLKAEHMIIIFSFAVIIAAFHFYFSTVHAVSYIKSSLGALTPDPQDGIHKRLTNVIDELHVASGNRVHIECLVIPTISMNALSAVDFRGNAIIAVTEGLLSRTSRTQLEAVVAHEACHILSGDCLETTVAASLFGIPSSVIEKLRPAFGGRLFFSPPFLFAWLMVKLSYLLNMFVSREREYRADAGAVRMIRNPLALAEALYLISGDRRGPGYIGAGLEMLCFMNPSSSVLDESDGWFADLMSTHPPVRKRIHILLNMSRAGTSDLKKKTRPDSGESPRKDAAGLFYALDNMRQWQGPYSLAELAAIPWLTALTWVGSDRGAVEKASQIPGLHVLVRDRPALEENAVRGDNCPSCRHPLIKKSYEDTTIYQCTLCGGALVEDNKLPRIIARTGTTFTERIKTLSRATLKTNQMKRTALYKKTADEAMAPLLPCPKCGDNMMRSFYSQAYLIELDRCTFCHLSWFEYNELEMLQCMIDNKMASVPLPLNPRDNHQTIPGI